MIQHNDVLGMQHGPYSSLKLTHVYMHILKSSIHWKRKKSIISKKENKYTINNKTIIIYRNIKKKRLYLFIFAKV